MLTNKIVRFKKIYKSWLKLPNSKFFNFGFIEFEIKAVKTSEFIAMIKFWYHQILKSSNPQILKF